LHSISKAAYERDDIPLVISLDYTPDEDVRLLATNFEWKHGHKRLIFHEEQLGLKKHIYSCGDLTAVYGSIILLEDDLVVSPYFYEYALKALPVYQDASQIAGISLYSYQMTENNSTPFIPIRDENDVFFMQVPSSWGQIWSQKQWIEFCDWRDGNLMPKKGLPYFVSEWSQQSWKKVFYQYILDTDKYFVYPYLSLSSNFKDTGTHIHKSESNDEFQVPLQYVKKSFRFEHFRNSHIRYDGWFEPSPTLLNSYEHTLNGFEYEVDLNGTKSETSKEYILTSRRGTNPIFSWSDQMRPLALNILASINGQGLSLYRTQDVQSFEPKSTNALSQLKIGIVVVIEQYDSHALQETLQSINEQINISIVCSARDQEAVEAHIKRLRQVSVRISQLEVQSTEVFAMARSGLLESPADIVFWMRQGVQVEQHACERINTLFTFFPLLSVACSLDDTTGKIPYRWTQPVLYNHVMKTGKLPSTQGWVFRKSAIDFNHTHMEEASDSDRHALFFLHLASNFICQPVDMQVLKNTLKAEIQVSERVLASQIKTQRSVALSILLRLYRHFGKYDNKYIQGFFTLSLELPLIYQYDEVNGTFYPSAY
jgi:hypothetical protein